MTSIDALGEFWLPDNPDRRLSGHLTFDRAAGGRLRLLGHFDDLTSWNDAAVEVHRLLGNIDDVPHTLDGCFEVALRGNGEQVVHVNSLLVGIAVTDSDEQLFDAITLRLSGLGGWLGRSGISQRTGRRRDGSRPLVIEARAVPSIEIPFGQGEIVISQHRGMQAPPSGGRVVAEHFAARIEVSDPKPWQELIELASDLQDLVSAGTHKPAAFEVDPVLSAATAGEAVTVMAQWHAVAPDAQRWALAPDCAFTFDDIGGAPAVGRWMDLALTQRFALGHVMGSRYHGGSMVADKLMNRCAALERFYRTTFHEKKARLEAALDSLPALADDPFLVAVGDVEIWHKGVRDARNEVGHQLGRTSPGGATIHYLAESAYWLFLSCMMRMADFPPAAFERLARCPAFIHDHARLRRLLGLPTAQPGPAQGNG